MVDAAESETEEGEEEDVGGDASVREKVADLREEDEGVAGARLLHELLHPPSRRGGQDAEETVSESGYESAEEKAVGGEGSGLGDHVAVEAGVGGDGWDEGAPGPAAG